MLIKPWTQFITRIYHNPWGHVFLLTLYYAAIIAALVFMYGKGNFTSPDFVYQGF
jgi:hypothetical protein